MNYFIESWNDDICFLIMNAEKGIWILHLVLGLVFVILMYGIQTVIHEIGHLFFGIVTGYKLLSLRIFRIVLLKKKNHYFIRKYHTEGSMGQCIMISPDKDNPSFILYIMGGVIANFLSALLSLSIMFSAVSLSFSLKIMLLLFTFYGIGFSVINGIPMNNKIANDGTVLVQMLNNKNSMKYYKKQIEITKLLADGFTYKEMPYEIFSIDKGTNLNHIITGYHKILECYYFMDHKEWKKALECLEEFYPIWDKLLPMLKEIILLEKVFLFIVTGKNEIEIDHLYNQVRGKMDKKSGDLHNIRIRSAYQLHKKGPERIHEYNFFNDLSSNKKSTLYPGEVLFCQTMLNEFTGHEIIQKRGNC